MSLTVGVLAVQGAVEEHVRKLQSMAPDVDVVMVRTPGDLAKVSGLIMPGGESTTISRLLRSSGLQDQILARAGKDLALLGTCAGLILLCSEADHDVAEKEIDLLGLLDAKVDRNSFGRQRESFEGIVHWADGDSEGIFIRAPSLVSVTGETESWGEARGKIVGARKGLVGGVAHHPELTRDDRVHQWFLDAAGAATV